MLQDYTKELIKLLFKINIKTEITYNGEKVGWQR
jgi:hypothetical protein